MAQSEDFEFNKEVGKTYSINVDNFLPPCFKVNLFLLQTLHQKITFKVLGLFELDHSVLVDVSYLFCNDNF